MKINYLSDFKVKVQPTLSGEPIDITSHDFKLIFSTNNSVRKYVCSHFDGEYTNCYIDGTSIVCVFDNHGLNVGTLDLLVYDYAPDATYPDGNELTVTPSEIDVELILGEGDNSHVETEVAIDITSAVASAQQAAREAQVAQQAAEDAAERASEYGGYTKSEADEKFALINGDINQVFNTHGINIDSWQIFLEHNNLHFKHEGVGEASDKILPLTPSGTIALLSDIPDISGKADTTTVNAALTLKADKTELNEVEDALHDAILDVSGRVDNKADKPLVVNITSEEVEGETVYHADKTTSEIHAAVLAGRNVVAHNDNYEFMLDAAESGMAIFSLSYSNGVQQIVISDSAVVLNTTTFANDDEFEVAKRNIIDLQDNKADKATTYTKGEVNDLLMGKADTANLAEVATSGSYNDLKDKPSVVPQEQADWEQTDSTAVDYIKHKPSVYTKSEVNNICPLIEDTRSSAVVNITGTAPFSTLEDGQRILLRLEYNNAINPTLTLTLSSGTTTDAIPIYVQTDSDIARPLTSWMRGGCYYNLIYNGTSSRWYMVGYKDTNNIYNQISDANITTGTETIGKTISAKTLRDNFYIKSEVNTALTAKADKVAIVDVSGTTVTQALQPNTFYRFGSVDSLTLTLAEAPSDVIAIYACSFTAATDNTTLTLPATIKGEAPTITAGHRYELNIMDEILLYTETDGND